jgi:hypothetical protein
MTKLTHQDIVDRRDQLRTESSKSYAAEQARIQKETEGLQELCGGLGHLYGHPPMGHYAGGSRTCVFCSAIEP